MSRHQSQPLSPDIIRLKDMVSEFPSSRPFDHLEVIATLGVGGFGRVELVRPESFILNDILFLSILKIVIVIMIFNKTVMVVDNHLGVSKPHIYFVIYF